MDFRSHSRLAASAAGDPAQAHGEKTNRVGAGRRHGGFSKARSSCVRQAYVWEYRFLVALLGCVRSLPEPPWGISAAVPPVFSHETIFRIEFLSAREPPVWLIVSGRFRPAKRVTHVMKNAVTLITGALGGIGSSLAREFARSGARLALCDVASDDAAQPLLAELREAGAQVRYRQVDVTNRAEMESFVTAVTAEFGGLDICIANAGIVERGDLIDLPVEAWRRTIEVNLTGSFVTAQMAARAMLQTRGAGHILFIGSWVQDVPRAGIGAYCAAKGGLKMLAKSLALELGPKGIRVNVIAPGWVDAGLTAANIRSHPELRTQMEQQIPLGRLITADDLARTVRLLCSDDASYLTGATVLVDGGASLCFRK